MELVSRNTWSVMKRAIHSTESGRKDTPLPHLKEWWVWRSKMKGESFAKAQFSEHICLTDPERKEEPAVSGWS
eukprot:scaffold1767_cov178-Ochromonas_danica.AAC.31